MPVLWLKLTLPDGYHPPTHVTKAVGINSVTVAVALNLVAPKLQIGVWQSEVAAIAVAMPKTAIYVYNRVIAVKHNVGRAWQTPHVQAIAVAMSPQPPAHNHFWLGVGTAYVAHAIVPLLWSHLVRHGFAVSSILTHDDSGTGFGSSISSSQPPS